MFSPRRMDAGMFLQSVTVLLRAEGTDTCPQIARAGDHETVAEAVEPPGDLALTCGMSAGYGDPAVSRPAMPRAQPCDVMAFAVDAGASGASEEDMVAATDGDPVPQPRGTGDEQSPE